MTIDEAIKEFTECAKADRKQQNYWAAERDETSPFSGAECIQLAEDCETRAECNEQLAEWLTELKELKALVAGYNPADIQTLEMLLAMMRNQNNNDTNLCELCDKEVKLKEAKRLLKLAVEQMAQVGEVCDCIHSQNCPLDECGKFTFHDEITKFIEG